MQKPSCPLLRIELNMDVLTLAEIAAREGFFGITYRWHYDMGYVVAFNMILFLLAYAQVRYMSCNLVLEV